MYLFYELDAGSSVESYEQLSFSSAFSYLGLFPEVFGQVNGWPILKLREMINVLHLVACPILFILFHDPN